MISRTAAIALILSWLLPPALRAADQQGPVKPVVKVCLDNQGNQVSADIAESSGNPEIDEAALKIARATKFKDAQPEKAKPKLSCIKFRVNFVVRDGELVPGE